MYKIAIPYPKKEIYQINANTLENANKKLAIFLWCELEDVPFIEDKNLNLILNIDDWHGWKKGTSREDIWHWFEEIFKISIRDDLFYNEELDNFNLIEKSVTMLHS